MGVVFVDRFEVSRQPVSFPPTMRDNQVVTTESFVSKSEASPTEMKAIDGDLNQKEYHMLLDGSTFLEFSVHEDSKKIVVRVVDKKTKDILREIPNEKILDIVSKLMEPKGIFLDHKG